MKKTAKKYESIHLSEYKQGGFFVSSDAFPNLMESGYYDVWHSPRFRQIYEESQFTQQSATLLKKYIPEKYHQYIRFTQNPNTWILSVNDKNVAKRLSLVLADNYQFLHSDELPQFLQLRHVYRNWENAGMFLSNITNFSTKPHIKKLCQLISNDLQCQIRLRYQPSVWRLSVPNANIAKRINLLLDDIALQCAREMGFAPKLPNVRVVPDEWEKSGFMLTELVKEQRKIPTVDEAEKILQDFLKGV